MTLDQILSNLLDALEEQDFSRTEKHAREALDYVESGKSLGRINKEELLTHVNRSLNNAREQLKKKNDLIESIVNFKE